MKILFVSLGCDKNLVDTENMLGILKNKGFEFTDDEWEADIIAINTCCFIGDAKQESINTILEMAEHKKDARCKVLVVAGCLAHRYQDEIIKEIPEVDAFVGTSSYDKIADMINSVLEEKGISNFVEDANRMPMVEADRIVTTPGYYEYLKIAEGCDKHCTYCVIPKVRGSFRSFPIEYLVNQTKKLVEGGVKEIILVAQETTLYGVDLYGKKSLPKLLHNLGLIEGLEWIRILYCYPASLYLRQFFQYHIQSFLTGFFTYSLPVTCKVEFFSIAPAIMCYSNIYKTYRFIVFHRRTCNACH